MTTSNCAQIVLNYVWPGGLSVSMDSLFPVLKNLL